MWLFIGGVCTGILITCIAIGVYVAYLDRKAPGEGEVYQDY